MTVMCLNEKTQSNMRKVAFSARRKGAWGNVWRKPATNLRVLFLVEDTDV
jgi:hypothetical protein